MRRCRVRWLWAGQFLVPTALQGRRPSAKPAPRDERCDMCRACSLHPNCLRSTSLCISIRLCNSFPMMPYQKGGVRILRKLLRTVVLRIVLRIVLRRALSSGENRRTAACAPQWKKPLDSIETCAVAILVGSRTLSGRRVQGSKGRRGGLGGVPESAEGLLKWRDPHPGAKRVA